MSHEFHLSEKALLFALHASLATGSISAMLDAMTQLAQRYIEKGWTQEGADILVYVLRHAQTLPDTREQAEIFYDDLACYICPRVLVDAQAFASKATFADMVEYIFAGTASV